MKVLHDNNLKLANAIENKGNTRNSRTTNPKNGIKYTWKKVLPKDSEPKTKQVKDRRLTIGIMHTKCGPFMKLMCVS